MNSSRSDCNIASDICVLLNVTLNSVFANPNQQTVDKLMWC